MQDSIKKVLSAQRIKLQQIRLGPLRTPVLLLIIGFIGTFLTLQIKPIEPEVYTIGLLLTLRLCEY